MAPPRHIKRLSIFVDGTWYTHDGSHPPHSLIGDAHGNTSNIYRMFASTKEGTITEQDGRIVDQRRKYYPGIGSADSSSKLKKLREGISGGECKEMIKSIYQTICIELTQPEDELWLFGYSRGAYIVRAVAGLFHHVHAISTTNSEQFDVNYANCLKLLPPIQRADRRLGGAIHHQLTAYQRARPVIKFVGVFDTVKAVNDRSLYDISLVDSIEHFRQALALNEKRLKFVPELVYPDENYITRMENDGQSFVQAWFLGSHCDIGAGNDHDGLSLYPLQWMLTESRRQGLYLEFRSLPQSLNVIDNPLQVVFPMNGRRWDCKLENKIDVEMYDLRDVHTSRDFQNSYVVRVNRPRIPMPTGIRGVFRGGALNGYFENLSQGTIIHPSVYHIFDTYPQIYYNSTDLGYRADIELFRNLAIPDNQETFWDQTLPTFRGKVSAVRILICGNTGVGKSTIINRVFGVALTQESDIRQGQHDINQAFQSPRHPRIIIHDSCGYAPGDTTGVKKLRKFLQSRSGKAKPEERLHVIWFCVDTDASRIRDLATEQTFRLISEYAISVPVIIIGTKKDKFLNQLRDESTNEAKFQERRDLIESELKDIPHGRFDAAVYVSKDDPDSITSLVKTTLECFDDEQVRRYCVAAQVTDIDAKVDLAISTTMSYYKVAPLVPILQTFGLVAEGPIFRLMALATIEAFGFTFIDPQIVLDVLALPTFLRELGLGGAMLDIIYKTPIGGISTTPLKLYEFSAKIISIACNIILVLEYAFVHGNQWVGPKDIETAARIFKYGKSEAVEKDVAELVQTWKFLLTPFWYTRVKLDVEAIVQKYREHSVNSTDVEQVEPPPEDNSSDDDNFADATENITETPQSPFLEPTEPEENASEEQSLETVPPIPTQHGPNPSQSTLPTRPSPSSESRWKIRWGKMKQKT